MIQEIKPASNPGRFNDMNRLPTWSLIVIGIVLIAFSTMGLVFAVHTSARVVYAVLLLGGIASLVSAYQRRKAAT